MNRRIALACAVAFCTFFATLGSASALTHALQGGGSYFGDVVVDPNEVVNGNLNVMFGTATIEGEVDGDVNVFGGSVDARPGSKITGQTNVVGGDYTRAVAPWVPGGASAAAQNGELTTRLTFGVIVLLVFLLFPMRVRLALDRVEQHPGMSAAAGTVAFGTEARQRVLDVNRSAKTGDVRR